MGAENGGERETPSSQRRKQLRDADANSGSIPQVSNFFPIERYYEASDKVHQSFLEAFEHRRLDEAYIYGMRYCTFCVEGISKHDYYNAQKYVSRRSETTRRVDAVLTKLEQVATWMDAEEKRKEEKRKALLKKQQEERLRRRRALEAQQLKELEERVAKQKMHDATKPSSAGENVEESAMAKLLRLSQPAVLPPPVPPPSKRVSFELNEEPRREPDGHYTDEESVLPPPLPPPSEDELLRDTTGDENMAPPSYHSILEQSQLASHTYFGERKPTIPAVDEPTPPAYDAIIKQRPTKPAKRRLNIREYIAQAAKRHRDYLQQRKIQVSALKTYQGRMGGSTNGCTVISACVVSKHLENFSGVTDAHLTSVIDSECVPLLRAIRSKLGLGSGSLIIPSDVHDHLVDHKLLHQHKFIGAAGGNIVNPKHFGELLKMLEGEPGKTQHLKAAATLFFREHVISIVKFPTSQTDAVFDMVDSLPTCNGRASRTRCTGLDALQVQLEWYSTHKFSESNCTYIERNRWNDVMADFDPRVFQAFVWADLPKPKPERQ